MKPVPHNPASFRDAIVQNLHRIWPEPMWCDVDVWLRVADDSRVVDVSSDADVAFNRRRIALAAKPAGDDT